MLHGGIRTSPSIVQAPEFGRLHIPNYLIGFPISHSVGCIAEEPVLACLAEDSVDQLIVEHCSTGFQEYISVITWTGSEPFEIRDSSCIGASGRPFGGNQLQRRRVDIECRKTADQQVVTGTADKRVLACASQ